MKRKKFGPDAAMPEASTNAADAKLAAARAMLAKEYHIEAAFVAVPKLSRVLGIAPSTIYGYMRRGEFFMPYRMINTTPMVSLDDLARWYCKLGDAALEMSAGQSKIDG